MSASKLRSDVWEHFIKHERTAKCKHCAKEFSFCGGTSNLRDHLLRAHERIYQPNKDSEAKTKKGKIEAFVTKTCSVTRENKITQLLLTLWHTIQDQLQWWRGLGLKGC